MNDTHYYNQMIRGEIYFLIDNLMAYGKTYEDDIIKNIYEFFEYYISFTVKFIDCLPIYLKEVKTSKNINKLNL